jgi:hypothetical protein
MVGRDWRKAWVKETETNLIARIPWTIHNNIFIDCSDKNDILANLSGILPGGIQKDS